MQLCCRWSQHGQALLALWRRSVQAFWPMCGSSWLILAVNNRTPLSCPCPSHAYFPVPLLPLLVLTGAGGVAMALCIMLCPYSTAVKIAQSMLAAGCQDSWVKAVQGTD